MTNATARSLYPEKKPDNYLSWLHRAHGRFVRILEKSFEFRTVQPVASSCRDYIYIYNLCMYEYMWGSKSVNRSISKNKDPTYVRTVHLVRVIESQTAVEKSVCIRKVLHPATSIRSALLFPLLQPSRKLSKSSPKHGPPDVTWHCAQNTISTQMFNFFPPPHTSNTSLAHDLPRLQTYLCHNMSWYCPWTFTAVKFLIPVTLPPINNTFIASHCASSVSSPLP